MKLRRWCRSWLRFCFPLWFQFYCRPWRRQRLGIRFTRPSVVGFVKAAALEDDRSRPPNRRVNLFFLHLGHLVNGESVNV